jgi:thiol-disulfide isomerase/thioredoxin
MNLWVYTLSIAMNYLVFLSKSDVKYKIVLFFTNWCPNSAESIPVLLDALKNKEELEIFMISPDDWIRKPSYLGYQRKYNLNQNIYLLDVYSYGEKRNPHYRMEKFISEICSDCKEIMGFPSYLVLDRENSIIFKHSGKLEVNRLNTILKI